jgi:hypothetical protein
MPEQLIHRLAIASLLAGWLAVLGAGSVAAIGKETPECHNAPMLSCWSIASGAAHVPPSSTRYEANSRG